MGKRDASGAGLPHLEIYYTAALVSRILDWFHHGPFKQWIVLDTDLLPVPLTSLPWLLPMDRPPASQLPLPLSSFLSGTRPLLLIVYFHARGLLPRSWVIQGSCQDCQIRVFFVGNHCIHKHELNLRGLKPMNDLSSFSCVGQGVWL